MTDTGQIPGEGQPENAGGQPDGHQPDFPVNGSHAYAGPVGDGLGEAPAPGFAPVDPDLLLPGSQGAWGDPQSAGQAAVQAQAQAEFAAQQDFYGQQVSYVHHESYGQPDPYEQQAEQAQQTQQAQHFQETAQQLGHVQDEGQQGLGAQQYAPADAHVPGPHEMDGRDSGAIDCGSVRASFPEGQTPAKGTPRAQTPPRRPLHLGPPEPEPSGAVRPLSDRGLRGKANGTSRNAAQGQGQAQGPQVQQAQGQQAQQPQPQPQAQSQQAQAMAEPRPQHQPEQQQAEVPAQQGEFGAQGEASDPAQQGVTATAGAAEYLDITQYPDDLPGPQLGALPPHDETAWAATDLTSGEGAAQVRAPEEVMAFAGPQLGSHAAEKDPQPGPAPEHSAAAMPEAPATPAMPEGAAQEPEGAAHAAPNATPDATPAAAPDPGPDPGSSPDGGHTQVPGTASAAQDEHAAAPRPGGRKRRGRRAKAPEIDESTGTGNTWVSSPGSTAVEAIEPQQEDATQQLTDEATAASATAADAQPTEGAPAAADGTKIPAQQQSADAAEESVPADQAAQAAGAVGGIPAQQTRHVQAPAAQEQQAQDASAPGPQPEQPGAGATVPRQGQHSGPAEEAQQQPVAAAVPAPESGSAPESVPVPVLESAPVSVPAPASASPGPDEAVQPQTGAPTAEGGAAVSENPAHINEQAQTPAPQAEAEPGPTAAEPGRDQANAPGPEASSEPKPQPEAAATEAGTDTATEAEPDAATDAAPDAETAAAAAAGTGSEAGDEAPSESPAAGDAQAVQEQDHSQAPEQTPDQISGQTPDQEQAPAPSPVPSGPPAPGYADDEREAVHRLMRERRDIRNGFRPDPIPHEVLLRVLEAAHTAPSVGHSQPWDFVVIRSEETRRAMHELAERQRHAYAESLPKARAKQFKELKIEAILDTPVNIVVTADPTRGGRHTLGRHTQPQMAPYSSALAVENLWLAARAEGLGVGWVSFFDEREMVRALELPEHLEVVAYLCVGYVDEFPPEPELAQAGWSKRRPLSWVVHEESYGRRVLPGAEPQDLLSDTVAAIRPLDAKALGEAWERQKRMTKPAGALGMLEIISAQLCGLSRKCPPPLPEPAAVAIFAGDHGVHAQGVTPWPQEVTSQMVANFLGGGAVCNAFANQVGAEVCVVDVGVASELAPTTGLLPRKVRAGTDDMTQGPAMSREEALRAVEVGIETARDLVAAGNKALLTGEMGIANTTASAVLVAACTGADPSEVTGRGTGINDETHARKVEVVRRALEVHQPDPEDPLGMLAAVGGLEHAALVGLILGGASLRTPVILDGVSAGAAALVARCIAPEALAACIAGHRSSEPGHVAALTKLGLRPLIDLDLRLGEGTGALLSLPMVQSAARAMHEVATFDSAGVTGKG